MSIHVVNKGKNGEREVVNLLQPMVDEIYARIGAPAPKIVRNQMQTAVGGYDLEGLPWIAIEVKRQEQLSLNAWWAQVLKACKDDQHPIVIYRQNRQKWRVLMWGWMWTGGTGHHKARVEVTYEEFCEWFKATCLHYATK